MINILFEDNHIIVAEKPYCMLSQADITGDPDILTELKKILKKKYNKPRNVFLGLVHRLDKNVGGVMVFAKTSKAASRLSKQVAGHTFQKKYYAVVEGVLKEPTGTLKNFLLKSESERRTIALDKPTKDAKYAELSYKVITSKDNLSMLDIDLKTGRAHQIRAQLANIGHPILGDKLYIEGIRDSSAPIALFAYSLEFLHPITQVKQKFIAKTPDEYPWSIFKL